MAAVAPLLPITSKGVVDTPTVQSWSFSEIKLVLKQVNEIGYSTAFVTAFENGVRINLQEAIKKTDKLD